MGDTSKQWIAPMWAYSMPIGSGANNDSAVGAILQSGLKDNRQWCHNFKRMYIKFYHPR